MAQVNQDFITYQGDNIQPIFLVLDANGAAVNISSVTQISWYARRNLEDAIALTKTKTGGAIAFTTDGTDGKFTLTLAAVDTQALTGWYMHYASVTDSTGNITTVTVGRMQVGLAPNWTYDDGASATEDIYYVRELIGDTTQSDQLLTDKTIFNSLDRYDDAELSAAECCRMIASKFARMVDQVQGQLKTNYSNRRRAYMAQAIDLEQRGYAKGSATAYVGGISISDKNAVVDNTDRVPPQFVIAIFDSILPEAPVGHQTNTNLGETQNIGDLSGGTP